jgi:uncharacterized ion transporter superfamily protein YfcC
VADENEARAQAIRRIKAKRAFQTHLIVFVLFNAFIWVIWALTGAGFPWPIFVTFFWGIGLVTNAWAVYGHGDEISEADIEREMRRGEGHG